MMSIYVIAGVICSLDHLWRMHFLLEHGAREILVRAILSLIFGSKQKI